MSLSLTAFVLLTAILAGGCGQPDAPAAPGGDDGQAAVDKDTQSRAWLVKIGTWRRELPFVTYETTFKDDGSLQMRQENRPAGGVPSVKTWYGHFEVKDGRIIYQTALANDDPFVLQYQIERVTASEFIQSTEGPLGKAEQRYVPAR